MYEFLVLRLSSGNCWRMAGGWKLSVASINRTEAGLEACKHLLFLRSSFLKIAFMGTERDSCPVSSGLMRDND